MNKEAFRNSLRNILHNETRVQKNIDFVKEVEAFLKRNNKDMDLDQLSLDDLKTLVIFLVETKRNSRENFLALLRYFRFARNEKIEICLLELIDGSNVLENLSKILEKTKGTQIHKIIFDGIDIPPLGSFSKIKPKITKKLVERLEAKLGEDGCQALLLSGPHLVPEAFFFDERKAFLKSKSLDEFLKKRHVMYIEELKQHMKDGTLYFTQHIDQDIMDYVRDNPSCQVGVRRGNKIYVTKIPYNANAYFREKNEKMKRYYYCHCSWVREGIKSGAKVSPNFCYCSAAFEKRPWDVIFGESVKVDVMHSVLKGDLTCKFAIHVPKRWLTSG